MRSIARIALLLAVAALTPLVTGEAAAQVPAAEAAAFIADWDLALQGDAPATIRVNITDADGQVAAVVTGIEGRETPVETITKSDENLVLSYTASIQGQEAPIEITLTPDGENLSASLDLAGMMTIPGTATKRQ
ncbi:MAG: hypothetical protein GEU90_12330 [Gemmatimonas sp.]|nr:hypothetical protein [Gemmatimonas sp.]